MDAENRPGAVPHAVGQSGQPWNATPADTAGDAVMSSVDPNRHMELADFAPAASQPSTDSHGIVDIPASAVVLVEMPDGSTEVGIDTEQVPPPRLGCRRRKQRQQAQLEAEAQHAAVALRHMQAEQYRVTVLRRRRLLYMLLLAADLLFFGGCLVYRLATNTALKNARRTGFGTSGQVVMWWLKPKDLSLEEMAFALVVDFIGLMSGLHDKTQVISLFVVLQVISTVLLSLSGFSLFLLYRVVQLLVALLMRAAIATYLTLSYAGGDYSDRRTTIFSGLISVARTMGGFFSILCGSWGEAETVPRARPGAPGTTGGGGAAVAVAGAGTGAAHPVGEHQAAGAAAAGGGGTQGPQAGPSGGVAASMVGGLLGFFGVGGRHRDAAQVGGGPGGDGGPGAPARDSADAGAGPGAAEEEPLSREAYLQQLRAMLLRHRQQLELQVQRRQQQLQQQHLQQEQQEGQGQDGDARAGEQNTTSMSESVMHGQVVLGGGVGPATPTGGMPPAAGAHAPCAAARDGSVIPARTPAAAAIALGTAAGSSSGAPRAAAGLGGGDADERPYRGTGSMRADAASEAACTAAASVDVERNPGSGYAAAGAGVLQGGGYHVSGSIGMSPTAASVAAVHQTPPASIQLAAVSGRASGASGPSVSTPLASGVLGGGATHRHGAPEGHRQGTPSESARQQSQQQLQHSGYTPPGSPALGGLHRSLLAQRQNQNQDNRGLVASQVTAVGGSDMLPVSVTAAPQLNDVVPYPATPLGGTMGTAASPAPSTPPSRPRREAAAVSGVGAMLFGNMFGSRRRDDANSPATKAKGKRIPSSSQASGHSVTPTAEGQSSGPFTPPPGTTPTRAGPGESFAGVRATAAVHPLPDMHTNPMYGSTPGMSQCGNEPTSGLATAAAASAAAAAAAGANMEPAAPMQPPAPLFALSTGAVGPGLAGGCTGEAGHAAAVPHNVVATALSSPAAFVHANGASSRSGGHGGCSAPAVTLPVVPAAAAGPAGARADAVTGQHGTGSTANASAAASALSPSPLQIYTPAAPSHRPIARQQQQQLPAPAVDAAIMSAAIQEARLVAERLRLKVQQKGASGTGMQQQQQQMQAQQPQPSQPPPQDLSPFPVLLRACSQGSNETPAETLAAVAAAARSPLRHSSLSRGSLAGSEAAAGVKAASGSVEGSPGTCAAAAAAAAAEAAPAVVSDAKQVGRGSRAPAGLQPAPGEDSLAPGATARGGKQQQEEQRQGGLTRPQQLNAAIEALQALQAQLQARQEEAVACGGGNGVGGGGGLAAAEELRRQLLQERQRLEALLREAA